MTAFFLFSAACSAWLVFDFRRWSSSPTGWSLSYKKRPARDSGPAFLKPLRFSLIKRSSHFPSR